MTNILRHESQTIKAKTLLVRNPTYLRVSKNILARQSIFKTLDCNIQDHHCNKVNSILTDKQIIESSIYERLEHRIEKLRQKQEDQIMEHQWKMRQLQEQIKQMKESIQEDKLEIWETKNQTLELEETFHDQLQQYYHLCQMIEDQKRHGYFYDHEQGSSYQHQQDSNFNDQEQSSMRQPPSEDRSQYSRPTCSIKFLISERSGTDQSFSKIQMQSEHKSQQSANFQTIIHSQENQQLEDQNPSQNILSFKKTQQIFHHY